MVSLVLVAKILFVLLGEVWGSLKRNVDGGGIEKVQWEDGQNLREEMRSGREWKEVSDIVLRRSLLRDRLIDG